MSGRIGNSPLVPGSRISMSSRRSNTTRAEAAGGPGWRGGEPAAALSADTQIRDLLAECTTETLSFEAGHRLVSEGEPSRELYCLRKGELAICQKTQGGAEPVHAFYYPEELLFPVAPGGLWSHSIRALSSGALEIYRLEEVQGLCQADGGFAYRLFLASCQALSHRLEQAARLRGMSVEGRFAAFLLEAGDRIGTVRRSGLVISLPMSRTDIASYLGLRTETLSRIIRRWRDRGLIDLESARRVAIRDTTPLEILAFETAASGPTSKS